MLLLGMLIYTLVGAAAGILIYVIVTKIMACEKPVGAKAGTISTGIISILALCFSLDWGFASVVEGEPQAMAIGFLIFGGIGIVFGLISYRVFTAKPKEKTAELPEEEEVATA